jgi:hypothetical protein
VGTDGDDIIVTHAGVADVIYDSVVGGFGWDTLYGGRATSR